MEIYKEFLSRKIYSKNKYSLRIPYLILYSFLTFHLSNNLFNYILFIILLMYYYVDVFFFLYLSHIIFKYSKIGIDLCFIHYLNIKVFS